MQYNFFWRNIQPQRIQPSLTVGFCRLNVFLFLKRAILHSKLSH